MVGGTSPLRNFECAFQQVASLNISTQFLVNQSKIVKAGGQTLITRAKRLFCDGKRSPKTLLRLFKAVLGPVKLTQVNDHFSNWRIIRTKSLLRDLQGSHELRLGFAQAIQGSIEDT